jgi:phage head maturation protease
VSIYNRTYICRIAPCSEDWRDAIRNGADVIDRGELLRESFAPDAWIATADPAPAILSHNEKQIVGHVSSRAVSAGWHVAAFVLDHSRNLSGIALDRLRIGAPVSIGFRAIRHDKTLAESGVKRYTLARLDELSILAADEKPAFPGARITQILESKTSIVRQPAAKKPPAVDLTAFLTGQERAKLAELRAAGFDPDHLRDLIADTCRPRLAAVR